MMKEFILKRLSKSLFLSRLFRIKALGTTSTISINDFSLTFFGYMNIRTAMMVLFMFLFSITYQTAVAANYITSERPLESQFEKYRIKINPLDMHHVMAFASLYIGDSQTMAAEAGVLGVPFVRFNDFVGRIGYLRELEDKYELGYGIHASVLPADSPIRRNDGSVQPSGVDALYKRVEALVNMDAAERRKVWAERQKQMLADKVDCAKFLTWFIENYPQSADQARKAAPKDAGSEFWKRFK